MSYLLGVWEVFAGISGEVGNRHIPVGLGRHLGSGILRDGAIGSMKQGEHENEESDEFHGIFVSQLWNSRFSVGSWFEFCAVGRWGGFQVRVLFVWLGGAGNANYANLQDRCWH